jgi:hypothetical protein
VREALGRLKSLDRDEWAASWSQLGDRYMAKKDFHQAWLYYSFARWPVPNSPGKQKAYERALEAYLAYAKRFDPPLEVIRVPYEGSEVVGYLRMPRTSGAVPLIIAIAGLDSRKEEMVERFSPLVDRGFGVLALDSPGTGQSGVKAAADADKSLIRVLDVVLARPGIDAKRVALYGGSYGGYWALSPAGGGGAVAADPRDFLARAYGEAHRQPRIPLRLRPGAALYLRREERGRARRSAREDVAQGARPARAADGADARDWRRARYAGADRRH